MLVIREVQKAVFADLVWDEFVASALELLRDQHAEHMAGMAAATCRRRVLWSLQQARAQGLQDGDHLIDYADCLLTYGPAFADHPALASALRRPQDADARWARLVAGMPAHVWRELALLVGDDDWLAIDGAPPVRAHHAS